MAVTTALPFPYLAALNTVKACGCLNGAQLCARKLVDADVLYELTIHHHLLTGPPEHVFLYPDQRDQMMKAAFSLTAAGRSQVTSDPTNVLLTEYLGVSGQPLRLDRAVAYSSNDAVLRVVSAGYATLHFAGDLRQTNFGGDVAYEFRHAKDFALVRTPKVRDVLG